MNMEILAQMYLRELIKEECWDSMTVKGKVLKVIIQFVLLVNVIVNISYISP